MEMIEVETPFLSINNTTDSCNFGNNHYLCTTVKAL